MHRAVIALAVALAVALAMIASATRADPPLADVSEGAACRHRGADGARRASTREVVREVLAPRRAG